MNVLIIGGAGYIGSHCARTFLEEGDEVIVLDNLSTGHKDAVLTDTFYEGDVRDRALLDDIFRRHKIDVVLHFAALSLVGISMTEPAEYYNNNVYGALVLLEAMRDHGVKKIVFSSTAAVYGEPEETPILEDATTNPTNPYGETKLSMEKMMHWFDVAYGIKSVALRYFNAAGASSDGRLGERHNPETHLIPLVLQVPRGLREKVAIYGNDYPTKDGTCIRDYIHVEDLARAHYLAAKSLEDNTSKTYNLGTGTGYSVREVIETARKVTGHPIPAEETPRRPGDPAVLVASGEKAKEELGFTPKKDLETMIRDAWNFYQDYDKKGEPHA